MTDERRDDIVITESGTAPARRVARASNLGRLAKSERVIGATSGFVAAYIRLVGATSTVVHEPRPVEAVFDRSAPLILTAWHGQAFLLPLVRPRDRPVDVLVSRHGDGEVIAGALLQLGCGTIRGSRAANKLLTVAKGGVSGFIRMKTALAEGRSVALTADSFAAARRKVGMGVVKLARASGRPIVAVGSVARRRFSVGAWDATEVSLPFNRIACIWGEPILVPAGADDEAMEAKRGAVEASLNAATARAHEIVDRRRG